MSSDTGGAAVVRIASRDELMAARRSKANLAGADLSGADLAGLRLAGLAMQGANLRGANLAGAALAGSNLSEADLSDARMTGIRIVLGLFAGQDRITSSQVAAALGLSDRMARRLLQAWVTDGWIEISNASRRGRQYTLSAIYRPYVGQLSAVQAHPTP